MREGFTIIECIFSLMVKAMTILLIQLVLPSALHLQNDSLKNNTDWYLFIERLEDPRCHFQISKVKNNQLILSDCNNEEYQIESGKHAVFIRSVYGGYLPILMNYHPGSIKYHQLNSRNVYVTAKMLDGEEKDAIVSFAEYR